MAYYTYSIEKSLAPGLFFFVFLFFDFYVLIYNRPLILSVLFTAIIWSSAHLPAIFSFWFFCCMWSWV